MADQATCSVCLRTIQLKGDKPIRHGFSAIGVQHGSTGGYHTGPCGGSGFPHLGISNEGTIWALGIARGRLADREKRLAELAGNPDLTWYPTLYNVRGRPLDVAHPVILKHGVEDRGYHSDGRPTYEGQHKKLIAEQNAIKTELIRTIEAYEKVLATWAPKAASSAPPKVETTHLAQPRKHTHLGEWTGIACRFTRGASASAKLAKTSDVAKVTCKRCKATVGL
jgi:hypothetical protein